MDIFYICLSYALFVFMIFFTIFTKTSLSAPMEYDFVKKHKLLTIGLVILGLFLVLFLYGILSYFHIPIISLTFFTWYELSFTASHIYFPIFLFLFSIFLFPISISVFYFFISIFLFPFQGVSHVYFSSLVFFGTLRAFRGNALLPRASSLPPLHPSSILSFLFKPSFSKEQAKNSASFPLSLFSFFSSFSKRAWPFSKTAGMCRKSPPLKLYCGGHDFLHFGKWNSL